MANEFWLSDDEWAAIEALIPMHRPGLSHGIAGGSGPEAELPGAGGRRPHGVRQIRQDSGSMPLSRAVAMTEAIAAVRVPPHPIRRTASSSVRER
jgi:hypothetical protein